MLTPGIDGCNKEGLLLQEPSKPRKEVLGHDHLLNQCVQQHSLHC